jgi:hypothetical protein
VQDTQAEGRKTGRRPEALWDCFGQVYGNLIPWRKIPFYRFNSLRVCTTTRGNRGMVPQSKGCNSSHKDR